MEEKRKKELTINIITTSIFSVLLLGSLGPAIMSPMMFDAPGSLENNGIIILFISVFTFPLVCLVSIIATWVFFGFKKYRASRISSLLPLTNFITLACGIVILYLNQGL